MKPIKAIDTFYKDYYFRSRLEARYAVFFDALGIEWFYEYEGYDLGGIWYLPDFWLPTFNGGMWAEVKPKKFTNDELIKAVKLVEQTNGQLMCCIGMPDFKVIEYLSKEYCEQHKTFKQVGLCVGLPNADQAEGENRMFVQPGYENEDGSIPELYRDLLGDTFTKAVRKARYERFSKPKNHSTSI